MPKRLRPDAPTQKKRPILRLTLICMFVVALAGAVVHDFGVIRAEPPAEVPYLATVINLPSQEEIEATELTEPEQILVAEPDLEESENLNEPETATEPIIRPMTVERQDNSYGGMIGRITIESVGLDLEIIQGAGSTEQSVFERLFYAVADKVDAELGVDNFILASHSIAGNPSAGFSPLLIYQDGSFDPNRALDESQLLLQIGDQITIFLESTQRHYTFEISFIEGDGSAGHSRLVELMADIEGRPQLTLYACSAVAGNHDGRVVVQAELVSIH